MPALKYGEPYVLKHPITKTIRGGDGGEREETITELMIVRPKAKHLRATDGFAETERVAMTLALLAALTGQPLKVLEDLDSEDLDALGAVLEGPTRPGQPTGETS